MEEKLEKLEKLETILVEKLTQFQSRLEKINQTKDEILDNIDLTNDNSLKLEKTTSMIEISHSINSKQNSILRKRKLEKSDQTNSPLNELLEGFKKFDKNSDGFISVQEIIQVMNERGYKISDEEVRKIIKEFDVNADGFIDYDEFIRMKQSELKQYKILKTQPKKSLTEHELIQGKEWDLIY